MKAQNTIIPTLSQRNPIRHLNTQEIQFFFVNPKIVDKVLKFLLLIRKWL